MEIVIDAMTRHSGLTAIAVAALATGVFSNATSSSERYGSISGIVGLGEAGVQSVVYLEGEGLAPVSIDTVIVDQIDRIYTPHLTTVPAGTTIEFLNSDPFLHNVYCFSDNVRAGIINYAMPHFVKRGKFHTFEEPGHLCPPLQCPSSDGSVCRRHANTVCGHDRYGDG